MIAFTSAGSAHRPAIWAEFDRGVYWAQSRFRQQQATAQIAVVDAQVALLIGALREAPFGFSFRPPPPRRKTALARILPHPRFSSIY